MDSFLSVKSPFSESFYFSLYHSLFPGQHFTPSLLASTHFFQGAQTGPERSVSQGKTWPCDSGQYKAWKPGSASERSLHQAEQRWKWGPMGAPPADSVLSLRPLPVPILSLGLPSPLPHFHRKSWVFLTPTLLFIGLFPFCRQH